jgi:copper chaperone
LAQFAVDSYRSYLRRTSKTPSVPAFLFRGPKFSKILDTPWGYTASVPIEENKIMSSKLKLAIEGMHCGACVRRVTSTLEGISGVKVESVEVGSAQLHFNPAEATAEQISATLDGIGFAARVEK